MAKTRTKAKQPTRRIGTIEQEHEKMLVDNIIKIVERESYETVHSDGELYESLVNQRMLVSKGKVYELRKKYGIPNMRERRILKFAEGK